MKRSCVILSVLLVLIATPWQMVAAADFYHLVTVRYETGLVKYFLGGPYTGKSSCEKLAQTVWDNVATTCGTCKREFQACYESSVFPVVYKRTFRNELIPNPYVSATPKGRIIFAGVSRAAAIEECQHTATQFRASGFGQAACLFH